MRGPTSSSATKPLAMCVGLILLTFSARAAASCSPGYFCPAAGSPTLCPASFYCPADSTAPLPCPAGLGTLYVGAATLDACYISSVYRGTYTPAATLSASSTTSASFRRPATPSPPPSGGAPPAPASFDATLSTD